MVDAWDYYKLINLGLCVPYNVCITLSQSEVDFDYLEVL